jgi:hypothetical protein
MRLEVYAAEVYAAGTHSLGVYFGINELINGINLIDLINCSLIGSIK